jgi:hypothetical protein
MKKLLLSLVFILTTISAFAQGSGFNYKALIAENGTALNTQALDIRFTILQDGTTAVYQETQNTTTDANGIVAVNIGEGTIVSGDFSTIDWGAHTHFLKVEIDTGSGYSDFGTSELKSVPYAKYADKAGNTFSGSFTDLTNVPAGLADGDDVNDADHNATNELQNLTFDNASRTLTISNGNSVTIPAGSSSSGDGWGTQTVQSDSSLSGDGTGANPLAVDTNSSAFSGWDKNASDDFSGNYNDLSNKPSVFNTVATSNAATAIADDIYHSGKIAIGTTSSDAVADEKLLVKTSLTSVKIGTETNDSQALMVDSNLSSGAAIVAKQNIVASSGDNSVIEAIYATDIINTKIGVHYSSPFNGYLGVVNKISNTDGYSIGVKNRMNISSTSITIPSLGVYNSLYGTGNSLICGVSNNIDNSGSGDHIGTVNRLISDGTGIQYGVKNEIMVTGNNEHYGIHTEITGSGTGTHVGNYTMLTGDGTGVQAATVNFIDNTANEVHMGIYNDLEGAGTGAQYGVKNNISNSGNGMHYGNYSELSGSSTGFHFGTYNKLTGTGDGSQIGTNNVISNTGAGDHVAIMNGLSGAGTGSQVGAMTLISNSGDAIHKGEYIQLSGEGAGTHYGIHTKFIGSGNGEHIGMTNELLSEGTGAQIAVNNIINNSNTTTTAEQIGVKNTITSHSNNLQFSIYNEMTTTGTGDKYGIFNNIDGVGIGDQYGTFNFLSKSTPGSGEQYGSFNMITGSGIGDHYAVSSFLNGTGSGDKYGVFSSILTSAGGTHYAIFGEAKKSGSYAGYFVGNVKMTDKLLGNDSGDADMKAYIYGSVSSTGGHATNGAHSDGFVILHLSGSNVYKIEFTNSPGGVGNYTVMVNMRFNQIGFITVKNNTDYFDVRTYNTSGSAAEKPFNFVVYKK